MGPKDVQKLFETILHDDAIRHLASDTKWQERQRKLDAVAFVRAMVIAASTGYGGRQADVMRLDFEAGGERVVRGGFIVGLVPNWSA